MKTVHPPQVMPMIRMDGLRCMGDCLTPMHQSSVWYGTQVTQPGCMSLLPFSSFRKSMLWWEGGQQVTETSVGINTRVNVTRACHVWWVGGNEVTFGQHFGLR